MREKWTLRVFMWLYLSFFASASVYLLYSGLYFDVMGYSTNQRFTKLSIEPYIWCYLFSFFILYPLGKLNFRAWTRPQLVNNLTTINIVRICLFMQIVYMILKLFQLTVVAKIGFGVFHDLNPEICENILYSGNPVLKYINYLGKLVYTVFSPFILLYLYYGGLIDERKKKLFLLYFATFVFDQILIGMVAGSRAMMFISFIEILFYFYAFKKLIFGVTLKKMAIIVFSLGILVVFVTINITSERFGNRMSVSDNVFRYLGESYPNLGFEFWNNLRRHTGGGHFFPFLQSQDILNVTNVHLWWFKTTYGVLYVDFGAVAPVIISIIVSLIVSSYCSAFRGELHKIGLVAFYFHFCALIPFGTAFDGLNCIMLGALFVIPKFANKFFLKKY